MMIFVVYQIHNLTTIFSILRGLSTETDFQGVISNFIEKSTSSVIILYHQSENWSHNVSHHSSRIQMA